MWIWEFRGRQEPFFYIYLFLLCSALLLSFKPAIIRSLKFGFFTTQIGFSTFDKKKWLCFSLNKRKVWVLDFGPAKWKIFFLLLDYYGFVWLWSRSMEGHKSWVNCGGSMWSVGEEHGRALFSPLLALYTHFLRRPFLKNKEIPIALYLK